MIIEAARARHIPRWYRRRVMLRVNRLIYQNPGFHRLIVRIGPSSGTSPYLVNPDIEPELRRLLGRVLILAPPIEDDDPWPRM